MQSFFSKIILVFKEDIQNSGLFWRISRSNTFIDLLVLQAGKASKNGITIDLALEVILIAVKALINEKFGIKDYNTNFNQLDKELNDEKDKILTEIHNVLLEAYSKTPSLSLEDNLNYFKVINNLSIENYSKNIFEDVLSNFLHYYFHKCYDK
jgi:hypothetical protein